MKNFFHKMLLGSALVLCAAGSASANQLLVYVTAGQIVSAVGAANGTALGGGVTVGSATTLTGNCAAGLTDCGVYGIGASSAVSGANTTTSVSGVQSPIANGTAAWVSTSLTSNSITYSGFEIGGTSYGDTQETFITANGNTTGKTYNANITGTNLTGTAAMNASTQIGFLLTFTNTIAAGTTVNLNLDLLTALFTSASNGTQFSKGVSSPLTLNGLTTVALPEPSSIFSVLGGLGALGFGAWRRRKMLAAQQQ